MHLTLSQDELSGYVSDVHFWRRSLSIDEMFDFTTCRSFQPGDILPWDVNDWRILNGNSDNMYFFKPRPRPSGLRRSDPDRDLTCAVGTKPSAVP